jgi:hypothetical protein
MKYLALIYSSDADWASLSDEDRESMYTQYRAFGEEARASGAFVDGAELQPASTATTVRVRDDDSVVTDGPFVETKEQLGGYYVLECDSIDDAVALAAKIPGAQYGTIEVRPAYVDADQGEEGAA